MQELRGISASPGIVIGRAFVYNDETPTIPQYDISVEKLEDELLRLVTAVSKASDELKLLKERSNGIMGPEDAGFIDTHILMLDDPEFSNKINRRMKEKLQNVEWILFQTIQELIEKLNSSQDEYLRERTIDIHDISKRVLNHLLYQDKISLADLNTEVILVGVDLMPSDALAMNKHMVKGIALDAGGKTSHTAILARSFEIPAVVGIGHISKLVKTGDEIIIDGKQGQVIIKPDENTKARYLTSQAEYHKREVELMSLNDLPAETKDGKLIKLKANIEIPEEVDSVLAHGADGVGLYRSEFLFMKPGTLPGEEEQFQAYKRVLENMGSKPVTIRTLDVGGDKVMPDFENFAEKNPILGWRAVRFCLSKLDLFKNQLRALLRASVYGNLRIMFPMISGIEELHRVLEILEECKEELRNKGIHFKNNLKIGIMIEVPSAAMTSDILAREVDFFSIGTNDLIQYTIAVDRGNQNIAYLYNPFHPGVLRLIRMVIENAHAEGIPVGMCGEVAGDPLATIILLGLGLDEYSMSAFGIPEVKRIIRSVSLAETEDFVGTIMSKRSYNEIESYVKQLMEERFGHFGY